MPPKMRYPEGHPKGRKSRDKVAEETAEEAAAVAEEAAQGEEKEDTNREDNEDNNGREDDEDDEANKDGAGGGDDSHDTAGSGDEAGVMIPLSMYFQPTEYKKKIRISTRCYVKEFAKTLENLEPPLTRAEKNWFASHPQFKHIFHLPKQGLDHSHKLQGMWMLLLRTARIEKKKEVWFVVNGVPIRYGLREHALNNVVLSEFEQA